LRDGAVISIHGVAVDALADAGVTEAASARTTSGQTHGLITATRRASTAIRFADERDGLGTT
jgi:hypothetical protein